MLNLTLTIRDPVHDYINLTKLEENIIDTFHFQRLRHIKQNSLAYFTYPTCQTNRFEHSLGVLAVGAKIYKKIFENRDSKIIPELLLDYKKFFFANKPEPSPETIDNTLFQSIRLACLLHDIGHFPFSHTIEAVIKDSTESEDKFILKKFIDDDLRDEWTKIKAAESLKSPLESKFFGIKFHELTSYKIVESPDIDIGKLIQSYNDENIDGSVMYKTVLSIMNPLSGQDRFGIAEDSDDFLTYKQVIYFCRSILDSEIDADRIDYLMRDSANSGATAGIYDVTRLINAFSLTISTNEKDVRKYKIAFLLKGFSAIQTFFIERLHIATWLHHHHNVIFNDALLRFILTRLILKNTENSIIGKINEIFEIFPIDRLNYKSFVKEGAPLVDDILFWSKLNELYLVILKTEIIIGKIKNKGKILKTECTKEKIGLINNLITDHPDIEKDFRRIVTYFEIILFRKRRKLSLWKDYLGYEEFCNIFKEKLFSSIKNLPLFENSNKKAIEEECQKKLKANSDAVDIINCLIERFLKENYLREFQKYLFDKGKIDDNNVFFIAIQRTSASLRTIRGIDSPVVIIQRNGKCLPLLGISPLLDSFEDVAKKQIRLYVFLISTPESTLFNNGMNRKSKDEQKEELRNKFAQNFCEWLLNESKEFIAWLNTDRFA